MSSSAGSNDRRTVVFDHTRGKVYAGPWDEYMAREYAVVVKENRRLLVDLGRALDWISTAGREVPSNTTVDAFLRTFPGEETSC